jgi:protein-tyrosine phosphatase
VTQADLVLTAERSHRLFVAQVDAEARGRTFTLTEFDRLAIVALRIGVLNPWELVAAAAALRGQFLPADPTEDDLPDPVQGSPGQHEAVVARIDRHTARIAASLVASTQPLVLDQVKGRRAALRW